MAQTALMIIILVFAAVWYTGRRMEGARPVRDEEPLIPMKVYAALLGAGLVVALLLH
jgi:hypothetical protein